MSEPRKDLGMWFCWICRKPLQVIHGQCPDATQFKVNGTWRDCHEGCYDEYSEGMPSIKCASATDELGLLSPVPKEKPCWNCSGGPALLDTTSEGVAPGWGLCTECGTHHRIPAPPKEKP